MAAIASTLARSVTNTKCQAWPLEDVGAWTANRAHSRQQLLGHRAVEVQPLAHRPGGEQHLIRAEAK